MREELARDERVFVLGEDVGRRGGVFLATDGFVDEFGEDRIIDTPLAESSIAGIALGAAMNGMRPIAEIQFADFIWPTFNQLLGEAAKARYGSEGRVGAPLVARTPYGGGVRGGLYHSQSVEAFFTHSPGIKVVAPATPYDAKGLLKSAVRDDDPVVFLEHKRTYRLVRGEVPDEEYTVPIGEADVKIEGEHLSVITYGLMLHHCAEAARSLVAEGISVEVVDLRTLFPMDTATVLDSVRKTGKALVSARGLQDRRRGRRGCRRDRGGGFRLPGRAHRAARRSRRSSHALQPALGGRVHAEHREDIGGHPAALQATDG